MYILKFIIIFILIKKLNVMETLLIALLIISVLFIFCAKLSDKIESKFIIRFGIVLIVLFIFTLLTLINDFINFIFAY